MRRLTHFISRCVAETPPRFRRCIAGSVLVLGCIAVTTTAMTCSHTQPGLEREQAIYRAGTNVVGQVQTLVPYLPPPVSTTAEVVLGVATALLAAWNTAQHKALRQLQNGKHPPADSNPSANAAGHGL
jgi:hypothetical protein